MGNTQLNRDSLINYADTLSTWDNYLDPDGDILIYGCNVGAGIAGAEFVEDLGEYTQADITASTDLTGSNKLGGDWDLELVTSNIETKSIFNENHENSYEHILFDSSFSFDFSLPDLSYADPSVFDFTSDLSIDNSVNFEVYDRFEYDLDWGFDDYDIGYLDSSKPSQPSFNLDTYDFSNPEINTDVFSFTPTQIDFSPTSFDFVSLSIDSNSISFEFDPSVFNKFSAKFDFLSEIDSADIKLAFEDYNFNFGSNFSFDADAVTIGTTGNNTITFDYDPNSFDFEAANLFKTNANLFDYKFLDSDISLINDEIPFAEYNASDYRALESAFVGDELFDPEYYLATNVIPEGQNPFTDYMENGYRAGKDPHALFDVDYYLFANTDVRITGTEPFSHYVTDGFKQLRNPHPLFNTAYYNEQNTDVANAGMNPLLHYVLFGDTEYHETRDPNAVFDSSYYSQMNPGVAESGMSALEHYWLFGWRESLPENPNGNPNRNPNPFVSTRDYFEIHGDVRVASYTLPSANPVQHLLEFGIIEGRTTHKIQKSNNIAKFSKIITPDSDPQEISNLQKGMEKDGYKLKLTNGSFEISQIRIADDEGGFNPFKPIEDAIIALTIFAGVGIKAYDLTNAAGEFVGKSIYEFLYGDDSDVSTITGISIFPEDTPSTDVTTISYGDPSLADLLGGTRAFPGQTESEIAVEIFKPPVIDGVEDFTIFPEEGIFLPSPTGFPKRDETLEDLLNDGILLGGENAPQGGYFLSADREGRIFYDPTDPFYEGATFYDKREPGLSATSYEDARNIALERLGEVDPSTREPFIGKFGVGKGKTVGFMTFVDGVPKVFRVDYDPDKKAHINIEVGKRRSRKKLAIEFPGTESDVDTIIKRFQQ